MAIAYISMGSNIGDSLCTLKSAIAVIEAKPEIKLNRSSKIYKTAPVGYTDQNWFLNCVIEIETTLKPEELLELLLEIEQDFQRIRTIRWGPRTLDLDIILFDDLEIKNPKLVIPHPRMKERAFVMVPLAELAPDRKLYNQSIQEIAMELQKE